MPDPIIELWRRDEEDDFESEATITRPDPDGVEVWDGQANKWVPATLTVYDGPCRLATSDANAVEVQAGERTQRLKRLEVAIPYDVMAAVDDTLELTSSPDPTAVGVPMRVTEIPKGDWVTTRPIVVEERD